MPNLRIIYDNAVDRAATIVASSTAGGLSVANLQTEYKGQVHRSIGTGVTYTITWASPQSINSIILPCTNLTHLSTVRVKLFSDVGGTLLLRDSGSVRAVTSSITADRWGGQLNANTFAFGGYSKAVVWLNSSASAMRCEITILDTSNPINYIDCSKIICGSYWSPTYNIQNGISHSIIESTTSSRAQSGDIVSDIGTSYETLSVNYALLTEVDRVQLLKIFKTVGSFKNIFISLLPSTSTEGDLSLYGRLRSQFDYSQRLYSYYDSVVYIESW